jgi:hypothetical protein
MPCRARSERPATAIAMRATSAQLADFSDPESECVLDAMAEALLESLALQAARNDDEAEWLASQQRHP